MVSINRTKDRSPVSYAVSVKRHDHQKPRHDRNVAMNARRDNSLVPMAGVNHVHAEHSERKAFSQLVPVARSVEQRRRLVHRPLRNARCQCAPREPIWMERKTCASNARKASTNPNHSKRHASHAHRITVPKPWPPPVAANARIHAKRLAKARPIVTSTHTAYWCRKRPISNVNASPASTEQAWNAKTFVIISVIIPASVWKIWRERRHVDVPVRSPARNVPNDRNSLTLPVALRVL